MSAEEMVVHLSIISTGGFVYIYIFLQQLGLLLYVSAWS